MAKNNSGKITMDNPFEQLTSAVYRQLFARIESFQMKPGEKINLTQLSEELNTSRTPVFEALKQLESLGFTERRPGHNGWYVSSLNRENAVDLCVARSTIETEAAFLCAQRGACPHILEMERLAEQYRDIMTAGGTCDSAEALDVSFHKLLLEDCGNKYLAHCYEDISKGLVRYQLYAKRSIMGESSSKLRQVVQTQHLSIVNAIRLCMPEFAKQEMENHMNTCMAIILSTVDNV